MWPYLALTFLAVGGLNVWIGFTSTHPDRVAQLLAGAMYIFAGVSIVVCDAEEEEEIV